MQRARVDRLQALQARSYTAELVKACEALLSDGVAAPAYALNEVAAAHADQRMRERAAER